MSSRPAPCPEPEAATATGRRPPTAAAIEGPYYRFDAPFRNVLAPPEVAGQRVRIVGTVFAPDGLSPLPGALLDIWHADASGVYDNHAATRQGDPFVLRGRLFTDERGRFEVQTILPEGYLLAPGYRRPKHVHLIVSHPDVVGTLTTQIYFAGDPYNASDPFVVPSLIVELGPDEAAAPGDPPLIATFDVVLSPER